MGREETLAREARWAKPAGIAALLAVAALLAGAVVAASVRGDGAAEILRSASEHRSDVTLSGALLTIGFVLFTAPFTYLFCAVQARSDRVQGMLIGLVVIAPLFLGLSTSLSSAARNQAADQFAAGNARSTLSKKEAKEECLSERREKGADFAGEFDQHKGETPLVECERTKVEDEAAENAESDASLSSVAAGCGIAGGLAIAIALFYTCLWAMRTGLLGRFWGSLGMALGIAILLGFLPFALLWFIYLGLLILGWVPGGRPPAWAAGEAIPWPTAGEKAAADLEGPADELGSAAQDPPRLPEGEVERPRKRKQRGPAEPDDPAGD